MKTGLKVAAAMMVIMSGTVIAAPFSVSSADMRDGRRWRRRTGLAVLAAPAAISHRRSPGKMLRRVPAVSR
jgi:hypothetical protein